MAKKWTKKETELLKKNVNKPHDILLGLLPNRAIPGILTKKSRLGLRRETISYWTENEINLLRKKQSTTNNTYKR